MKRLASNSGLLEKEHASQELEFRQGANPKHEITMQEAAKKLRVAQELVKPSEKRQRLFLARIDKNGPLPDQSNPHYQGLDRCWDWKAFISPGGYGVASLGDGRPGGVVAHRMSYAIHKGIVPQGAMVLHRCDNRRCVNPEHLYLGSHQDNMRDKVVRNRAASGDQNGSRTKPETRPRGDNNWISKLREDQIKGLRDRYAAGGVTLTELAREFGVVKSAMTRAVSGKTWKTIPMEKPYVDNKKLTAETVERIRNAYHRVEISTAQISKEFGISGTHVRKILRGEKWEEAGGPIVKSLAVGKTCLTIPTI